jgi:hypothetical protein
MSEVKRYSLTLHKVKGKFKSPEFKRDNGEWVRWQDYARLQAEVEHLSEIVQTAHSDLFSENARLKAEVERLRNAGDELEVAFQAYTYGWPYEPLVISKAIHRWKAAKEGKQS